jgi:hypothetical protein
MEDGVSYTPYPYQDKKESRSTIAGGRGEKKMKKISRFLVYLFVCLSHVEGGA